MMHYDRTGVAVARSMVPRRRGNRLHRADRHDPIRGTMRVDELHHDFGRRSSSAWVKKAELRQTIPFLGHQPWSSPGPFPPAAPSAAGSPTYSRSSRPPSGSLSMSAASPPPTPRRTAPARTTRTLHAPSAAIRRASISPGCQLDRAGLHQAVELLGHRVFKGRTSPGPNDDVWCRPDRAPHRADGASPSAQRGARLTAGLTPDAETPVGAQPDRPDRHSNRIPPR